MRVNLGFSGEMKSNQWRKGDIDVDEVDFARILLDADIDVDPSTVPRRLKFSVLEAEATVLLYAMIANAGGDKNEIERKINAATAQMNQALERIRGGS